MSVSNELEGSLTTNTNEASKSQFIHEIFTVPKTSNEVVEQKELLSNLPSDKETCEITTYIGDSSLYKRRKVQLYIEDKGPKLYNVKGKYITPPLLPKNLLDAFDIFPIFGKPKLKQSLEEFQKSKIKEFISCVLNDNEFETLSKYCSPDHLKTGKELVMSSPHPMPGITEIEATYLDRLSNYNKSNHLCVVKKHKLRVEKDPRNQYPIKLKYRSLRLMSLGAKNEVPSTDSVSRDNPQLLPVSAGEKLQPGRDLLYTVRVYRPFYSSRKDRFTCGRIAVLSCEVSMCGRQPLTALRDRMGCYNDPAARLDVSLAPRQSHTASAKDLFPSGFLFINNVFYVDTRAGCADISAGLRAWARRRGLGDFPRRDMDTQLQDIGLRLGHPEVYVHQGKCEHLFTFSQIRLVSNTDPLDLSSYPCYTAVSHNQTVYCMTCAEFSAKWLVTGCDKVPFDPAFFCETCFYQYLYKDDKKIGDFKAYAFKGNEINLLKTTM